MFLALLVEPIVLHACMDVCNELSIPLELNSKFSLFIDVPCILLKGVNDSVALRVEKKQL